MEEKAFVFINASFWCGRFPPWYSWSTQADPLPGVGRACSNGNPLLALFPCWIQSFKVQLSEHHYGRTPWVRFSPISHASRSLFSYFNSSFYLLYKTWIRAKFVVFYTKKIHKLSSSVARCTKTYVIHHGLRNVTKLWPIKPSLSKEQAPQTDSVYMKPLMQSFRVRFVVSAIITFLTYKLVSI